MPESILLARQPIFDINMNVDAYELLFRNSYKNSSGVTAIDGDQATTEVINRTFIEMGIEKVLDDKRGFINLTHSFLTGKIELPFDSTQIVLEILEDIEVDDEIIASVSKLSKQGYTIALDDFIYNDEFKPLIKLASIIKIDILAITEQELHEHVELLKNESVTLLAEKVETEQQFQLCRQLGFELFQGYFFCKPNIIDDRPLPENKISALRLLSALQKPDATIDEVESLVSQDASISYKLLRTLNSSAFNLPKKIDSLRHGIMMLGLKTITSWVSIIALSEAHASTSELLITALVRAKMAEKIAANFSAIPETAFLVGLLSPLDAILQKPMAEVLESIPLDEHVKLALIDGDGQLGELLRFVVSYEEQEILCIPDSISPEELNNAYLAATEWASMTQASL
jgi:EAL and modified HD-GYP domain-containing signal transduction protein